MSNNIKGPNCGTDMGLTEILLEKILFITKGLKMHSLAVNRYIADSEMNTGLFSVKLNQIRNNFNHKILE